MLNTSHKMHGHLCLNYYELWSTLFKVKFFFENIHVWVISGETTTALHSFNGLFSGQPGEAGTIKANHCGFYWSKRWWGCSSIIWTICKSFAPCCRQITVPIPHHSVFTVWMTFLLPNQQHQSTEGKLSERSNYWSIYGGRIVLCSIQMTLHSTQKQ